MATNEIDTGITLPDNGVITIEWAKEALDSVSMFSTELLNYGRGKIMFMLQANMGSEGFKQAVAELGYTVETANVYISYLQKQPILEAIKEKYYTALSLSAAQELPDSEEDALALCDVCVAKYGRLTADNLQKAAEASGVSTKKLSDSAVGIEALKKKALNEWLAEEFDMSEDDILNASHLKPEGLTEFRDKMANAYSRLEGFKDFYSIIAQSVHDSHNAKAMRFLADITDASGSIEEYLTAETAYLLLAGRKETFEQEVYPEIQFETHTQNTN